MAAIYIEGGRPVLVLDEAPYPPKANEVASCRAARDAAELTAQQAELAQDCRRPRLRGWKRAARPQEPFVHAAAARAWGRCKSGLWM